MSAAGGEAESRKTIKIEYPAVVTFSFSQSLSKVLEGVYKDFFTNVMKCTLLYGVLCCTYYSKLIIAVQ